MKALQVFLFLIGGLFFFAGPAVFRVRFSKLLCSFPVFEGFDLFGDLELGGWLVFFADGLAFQVPQRGRRICRQASRVRAFFLAGNCGEGRLGKKTQGPFGI